ncbi:MAG: class I SAM-dependent methyltransferase [Planctomycetota bacterium]
MAKDEYLHGYEDEEQRRLIRQADYWRERLLPIGVELGAGECLLELGCGVGAVLGVLAQRFPEAKFIGVDIESRQLESARQHMSAIGRPDVEFIESDASSLPLADDSVDQIFIIWLIEHLEQPIPVLKEALRVLKPGGVIHVTETDYSTFQVVPRNESFNYLKQAQFDYYDRFGNARVGPQLGNLLAQAGFQDVDSRPVGFHAFTGGTPGQLRAFTDYIADFLVAAIPTLASALELEEARLREGADHLLSLADRDDGALSQIVYRARAFKR